MGSFENNTLTAAETFKFRCLVSHLYGSWGSHPTSAYKEQRICKRCEHPDSRWTINS